MSSESEGVRLTDVDDSELRQRETAGGPEGDQEQLRMAGLKHLAAQQAGVPCGPDCDCRAYPHLDKLRRQEAGEGETPDGLPRRRNPYELGWAERRRLAQEEAEGAKLPDLAHVELRLGCLVDEIVRGTDLGLRVVLDCDRQGTFAIAWRIRALTRLDGALEAIRSAAGAAGGTVHCLLEDERDALRVHASSERGKLG